MKKTVLNKLVNIAFILISLSLIVGIFLGNLSYEEISDNAQSEELIRIHILANSNNNEDMYLKLLVRNSVLEYISNLSKNAKSKEEVLSLLNNNILEIEKISNDVLSENKALYNSKASINVEEFPIRLYDSIVTDKGDYDALIITLGEGDGDNWWCIAFPPLCFKGKTEKTEKVKVKSRVGSWFSSIFKKNK